MKYEIEKNYEIIEEMEIGSDGEAIDSFVSLMSREDGKYKLWSEEDDGTPLCVIIVEKGNIYME